MGYTVLAYSYNYYVSLYNTLYLQGHTYYQVSIPIIAAIKSYRIYLTNHTGFIPRHTTPLVINSLMGGYTHMHTNFMYKSNYKKLGEGWHAWFNTR